MVANGVVYLVDQNESRLSTLNAASARAGTTTTTATTGSARNPL